MSLGFANKPMDDTLDYNNLEFLEFHELRKFSSLSDQWVRELTKRLDDGATGITNSQAVDIENDYKVFESPTAAYVYKTIQVRAMQHEHLNPQTQQTRVRTVVFPTRGAIQQTNNSGGGATCGTPPHMRIYSRVQLFNWT